MGYVTRYLQIKKWKSALEVENMLMPYKKGRVHNGVRQPKEPITPEVCMDVLQATNYARNIRDMLALIADLPPEAQKKFKSEVLATFQYREQPEDIARLGRQLAETGEYAAELAALAGNFSGESDILLSAPTNRLGLVTEIGFGWVKADFAEYDWIKASGDTFDGTDAIHLPKVMDFSACNEVNLANCDLAPVKSIAFKLGSSVDLTKAKNFPETFDLSMCGDIVLGGSDFAGTKILKLGKGKRINLYGVDNLPKDLDASGYDEVFLGREELMTVKRLKLKGRKQQKALAGFIPGSCEISFAQTAAEEYARKIARAFMPHRRGGR